MAKKTYKDLLRKPQWQKKRLQILERDKWSCQCCGDTETELQVHHKRYESGKRPWQYADEDLTTFCLHCHSFLHYIFLFQAQKPTINEKLPAIQKRYVESTNTYYMDMLIDNNMLVTGFIQYDSDNEYWIDGVAFYQKETLKALFEYLKQNYHG